MKFFTPDELAKILRISKTGVYRLIENRAINFYRISGVLRFELRDIESFIRKGRVESVK